MFHYYMPMKTISADTETAIAILEDLPENRRKSVVEKLREIAFAETEDEKWDRLLEEHPEPMLQMAEAALKEHKVGLTKPLEL